MKQLFMILSFIIIAIKPLSAQNNEVQASGFDTLSLQDLMNIKLTVASVGELTRNQSPAIVTSISAEEIRNLGATDLMTVLKQIPGFEFGVDVEGALGLGIRGNWSHEGKAVLFIDGQEMNDGLFSTLQFGNHYPVYNIEKIEIIRGPGSAMYGGNAAHAVINITTKKAKDDLDVKLGTHYNLAKEGRSARGMYGMIGSKFNNGNVMLSLSKSDMIRSMNNYTDIYGSSYNMKDNSDIDNAQVSLKFNYGNLSLTSIKSKYDIYERDEYVEIIPEPILLSFDSWYNELKYMYNVTDKFSIIPSVNYRIQKPWNHIPKDDTDFSEIFNYSSERYSGSLNTVYEHSDMLSISSGATYFKDIATDLYEEGTFRTTGTHELSYDNLSLYTQGQIKVNTLQFILGGRFNKNSRYESTVVPRFGITGNYSKFHFKALASQSFRAPSTLNIDYSEEIKPEISTVYELEIGLKTSTNSYLTINGYNVETKFPIVYFYDNEKDLEGYTNKEQSGTHGIELEYRYKVKKTNISASISYYQVSKIDSTSNHYVNSTVRNYLGLAPVKSSLSFTHKLYKNLSFNMNGQYLSKRYGIGGYDEITEEQVVKSYSPQIELNSFLSYQNKGLNISIGVNNLLDQEVLYLQPYRNDHAPIPGMGRTLQIKIDTDLF